MRKSYLILLLVFIGILIASCGTEPPAPSTSDEVNQPTQTTPTLVDEPTQSLEGYPAVGNATSPPLDDSTSEGYPAPETNSFPEDLPEELTIPTPDTNSGIVTGQLLTPGPGGDPYITSLYLARTIESDKAGYPPIITFSNEEELRASQDQTGKFLFESIEPGIYGLTISTSTIIEDPDTGEYLLVEVRAGEIIDLGVIEIP